MNKQSKKDLYGSIMKSVAKTVKNHLNESVSNNVDDTLDFTNFKAVEFPVFYIMSPVTANALPDAITMRGCCYDIDDSHLLFNPESDDPLFFIELDRQLLKMADRHMFNAEILGNKLSQYIKYICKYI